MEKKFFTHNGQQQFGPFSIDELINQKISKTDMLWCEGMENWQAAENIEELKPLFVVVPPPIIKPTNVSPPVFANQKNATQAPTSEVDDTRKKKRLIYIILGAVALFLIGTTIVLIAAFSGNKNDIDLNAKLDSLKAVNLKMSKNTDSVKDEKNMTLEEKEAAKKENYKKNWKSYISVKPKYATGPMGGISNATVTLTNYMPYVIDQVTISLSYIRVDNSVYKYEKVTFSNVAPNSSPTKPAPWSDKGMNIKARISKVSSKILDFNYPEE